MGKNVSILNAFIQIKNSINILPSVVLNWYFVLSEHVLPPQSGDIFFLFCVMAQEVSRVGWREAWAGWCSAVGSGSSWGRRSYCRHHRLYNSLTKIRLTQCIMHLLSAPAPLPVFFFLAEKKKGFRNFICRHKDVLCTSITDFFFAFHLSISYKSTQLRNYLQLYESH